MQMDRTWVSRENVLGVSIFLSEFVVSWIICWRLIILYC